MVLVKNNSGKDYTYPTFINDNPAVPSVHKVIKHGEIKDLPLEWLKVEGFESQEPIPVEESLPLPSELRKRKTRVINDVKQ